jgi:hypothetical protein
MQNLGTFLTNVFKQTSEDSDSTVDIQIPSSGEQDSEMRKNSQRTLT